MPELDLRLILGTVLISNYTCPDIAAGTSVSSSRLLGNATERLLELGNIYRVPSIDQNS